MEDPIVLAEHAGQYGVGQFHGTQNIDGPHLFMNMEWLSMKVTHRAKASIVDQNIDLPVLNSSNEGLDFILA